MISLLGSLLGFGSSLIGPVLEAWNKSSDQKHELAMLHAQAEVQSKLQDQRLRAMLRRNTNSLSLSPPKTRNVAVLTLYASGTHGKIVTVARGLKN